jgi:hypothetical protein
LFKHVANLPAFAVAVSVTLPGADELVADKYSEIVGDIGEHVAGMLNGVTANAS